MKNKLFGYLLIVSFLSVQVCASSKNVKSALTIALAACDNVNTNVDANVSPLVKGVRKAFDGNNPYKAAGLVADAVATGNFSPILAEELGDELIVISQRVLSDETPSPKAIDALVEIAGDVRYAMNSPRNIKFKK